LRGITSKIITGNKTRIRVLIAKLPRCMVSPKKKTASPTAANWIIIAAKEVTLNLSNLIKKLEL
jgi:hypothetical protein